MGNNELAVEDIAKEIASVEKQKEAAEKDDYIKL